MRPATSDLAGAFAGVGLCLASQRHVGVLLFGVTPTDPAMLALPVVAMLIVALLSGLPPSLRAARVDPAAVLRGS